MGYALGIDFGTSGLRAILINEAKKTDLADASFLRTTNPKGLVDGVVYSFRRNS